MEGKDGALSFLGAVVQLLVQSLEQANRAETKELRGLGTTEVKVLGAVL